jgi:1,4-alpha-glucan branching enzyme
MNSLQAASHSLFKGKLGATIHEKGVFFRVWAPNVAVIGEFSQWQALDMAAEEDGYWGIFSSHAQAGHLYKYLITTLGRNQLERNDPCARLLTHSSGD